MLCIFFSIKLHQHTLQTFFPANYPHLGPYLIIFLFGSFSAMIFDQFSAQKNEYKTYIADTLICCILLLILLGIPLSKDIFVTFNVEYAYHFIANPFFSGILSAILILSINHSQLFRKLFNSTIMIFLGKISFGAYLLHILCLSHLQFLSSTIGVPLTIVIISVGTFSFASLSYLLIEKPVIKYVNMLKLQ